MSADTERFYEIADEFGANEENQSVSFRSSEKKIKVTVDGRGFILDIDLIQLDEGFIAGEVTDENMEELNLDWESNNLSLFADWARAEGRGIVVVGDNANELIDLGDADKIELV